MTAAATVTTPEQYIDSLPPDRKEQVETLVALIRKTVPGLSPCMTSRMLGFGPYHYRYASGREGDTAVVALASQKNYLALYICACDATGYIAEQYRDRLPKANIGKSCVRFKKLEDLDLAVVREMLKVAERAGGMGACAKAKRDERQDAEDAKGRNAKGRNAKGRNAKGRNAKGRNAKGRNAKGNRGKV